MSDATPPPAPPEFWPGSAAIADPAPATSPEPSAPSSPSWLAPGAKAPEPPPPPAPVEPGSSFTAAQSATLDSVKARAYAEWFVWARQRFADQSHAQAAARGAMQAALAGADAAAAEAAGLQAAAHPDAPPAALDPRIEAYASWYAWANLEMRAHPDVSHEAATAASLEQARGARPEIAAQAATSVLASARSAAKAQQKPLLSDPAMRSVIMGLLCLGLPIGTALTIGTISFLRYTPALGVIYAVRSLGSGRTSLALTGLALNGVACVLALLLLVHAF